MGIIDTLSLRFNDPVAKLSSVLDEIGRNKNADIDALLWGNANRLVGWAALARPSD